MLKNTDVLYIARSLLGVGGISKKEKESVHRLGRNFELGMLCIALWLPLGWYLQMRQDLPDIIFNITNWIVWLAFIAETSVMTFMVKHKFKYLSTNWLNLVIIALLFPDLWPHMYLATAVRIIRICIMFRFLIPWMEFSRSFLAFNHLGTTLLVAILLTTSSGLILATFDPGIPNAAAGIWWAWQTITSVGYGDVVPVTLTGRVIAVMVMIFAIGLIAVLTANFSAFLIERTDKAEKKKVHEIHLAMIRIEEKLDTLLRKIGS